MKNMKNNDLMLNANYTAPVIDMNTDGDGVCKIDGNVVFVSNALPGEIVQIKITDQKKSFALGKVCGYDKTSPDRIQPLCPYYSECGGCNLQHLKYEKQLEFKKQQVFDSIKKIAKVEYPVNDCIASQPYYYRNKIALDISKNHKIALKKRNSHENIEIIDCLITQKWISDLIKIFNDYIEKTNISIFDEKTNAGLLKNIVVRAVQDSYLITFVINGTTLPQIDMLISLLKLKYQSFGLNVNINRMNNQIILTDKFKHIYGLQTLKCNDFDIEYEISSGSFMQVNDYIKNKIYSDITANINNEDIVIDAYSGAGLLSAIMSKKCKQCHGIEIVKQATDDAEKLKILNNITNLFNHNGDCLDVLPDLLKKFKDKNTIVVLDPPRKGCDKKILETLNKYNLKKIIYVSCNPQTLARDISVLSQTYEVKSIQPYDMFPQTQHVENVVIFEKK